MDTSSSGQHEDLVRRIFEEGWNRRSFECLTASTASSITMHYNGVAMTVTPDSLPDLVDEWRSAFPDLEMRIRHLVAVDDLVAVSLSVCGTHRGDWRGFPARGAVVEVEEMMFFRFEDGLLVEMWEVFDELGMHAQLKRP